MRLLGSAARTAVVAGAAARVHRRVAARQQGAWAASTTAPPPPASERSVPRQLKELGELRESGVLTDAEFEAAKAKILHAP
ncbi:MULTISPECIES: SHOCT domain-containing protein [unclassified Kribbella]|uniref:SHOCT domain-containing protein n=1 Tax=unclassified Kribbella TaxID=2644121 RepID=UPI00301B4FEE